MYKIRWWDAMVDEMVDGRWWDEMVDEMVDGRWWDDMVDCETVYPIFCWFYQGEQQRRPKDERWF